MPPAVLDHESLEASAPWHLSEALDLAAERSAGDSRFLGLELLDRRGATARAVSWHELRQRVRRRAAGLRDRGVRPGDRLALVLQTSVEFFELLLAASEVGAVPVPLYPPVRLGGPADYAARTCAMLAAVDACWLVTDARLRKRLRSVLEDVKELVVLDVDELEGSTEARGVARDPEDFALVQFSSGTTGSPRPVALTHRALLAQARILNSFWPDEADGPSHSGVSWLPLYHDMGLVGGLLPVLLRPSRLSLLSPESFVSRPALWLQTISRKRATVSAAPDFAYRLCVERVRDDQLEGVDLSTWRFALNGAEAVSSRTLQQFGERFAPWGLRPEALTPVYGLAEAALAVTFSAPETSFVARRFERSSLEAGTARPSADGVDIVSVGRPVPHFEVEIRDVSGKPAPEGCVGSVWARGPSLFAEYLGQPEATAATLQEGWMNTGDLGFFDDGELFLCGRDKDVLVLNGRNIDPTWVERAVAAAEGVLWGGVVAASWELGADDGERLVVLAERSLPAARPASEIVDDVRRAVLRETGLRAERVALFQPGDLPRTSSGKLRRQAAAEHYFSGRLEGTAE
ncbi:MAG: AMP-binding protein [Acidobacteriota bacterium]